MTDPVAAVVLAAGKGTRMKSDLPKVLHPVAHRPMIGWVLDAVAGLGAAPVVVVVGPDQAQVAGAVAPLPTVVQAEPRGTGDAARAARPALEGFAGTVLVLFADNPLVTVDTLRRMAAARAGGAGLVALGFEAYDPARYGRFVLDAAGALERIVETADADEKEREIRLCNGGIMAVDGRHLFDWLDELRADNAQGEFYLTDLVAIARRHGARTTHVVADEVEVMGVDSRAGLAKAEARMQARLRARAMEAGVSLVAPETVFLAHDTRIGRDTVVHPNVVFGPGVEIGEGVEIRSFSHLEAARVAAGAIVGPYARLRPGADIGEGAHIGNFVEIKAATVGAGAKANHLSYIGDASVGAGANIGAGTITCNYDGVAKHRTEIGAGVFIGSNTALVAPVSVGDGAMVGAGSTVTRDVEAGALVVTRGEEKHVAGGAGRFRARRRRPVTNKQEPR